MPRQRSSAASCGMDWQKDTRTCLAENSQRRLSRTCRRRAKSRGNASNVANGLRANGKATSNAQNAGTSRRNIHGCNQQPGGSNANRSDCFVVARIVNVVGSTSQLCVLHDVRILASQRTGEVRSAIKAAAYTKTSRPMGAGVRDGVLAISHWG